MRGRSRSRTRPSTSSSGTAPYSRLSLSTKRLSESSHQPRPRRPWARFTTNRSCRSGWRQSTTAPGVIRAP